MILCFYISASNTSKKLPRVSSDAKACEHLLCSRGLSFGQGVFETILVKDGVPKLWSEHMHRLERGAKALGLRFYPDQAQETIFELLRRIQDAAQNPAGTSAILKMTLFSGQEHPGGYAGPNGLEDSFLRLEVKPGTQGELSALSKSLSTTLSAVQIQDVLYPAPAQLRGLKLTSATCYVHWSKLARAQGFDYGVLFDERGLLVESTSSNILLVSDQGVLQTPAMKAQGVWGTLRHHLLDKQLLVRADLNEEHLYTSKAVYFFNSIRGFHQLHTYSGSRGEKKWSAIGDQNDIKSLSSLLNYVRTILVGLE